MASDLVLRLCQVDEEDGGLPGAGKMPKEPGYIPAHTHIALSDFTDGLFDLLGGYHTPIQMKTFYNMSPVQQAQFDVLVGKINSATNMTKMMGRIQRFRSILCKWERRQDLNLANYDTPDDIETWLMALDAGFL